MSAAMTSLHPAELLVALPSNPMVPLGKYINPVKGMLPAPWNELQVSDCLC